MIVLQQRDRNVLRLAYDHQFILFEHVREYYPQASQRSEPYRRLAELKKAGYLRQETPKTASGLVLYRLTQSGRAWVESREGVRVKMKKRIALATLLHDARVASVRQRLSEFWEASFIPERALKEDEYSTIPDGVFQFASGKKIALEFENSEKGKTRFLGLIERWKDVPSVIAVLYVACDDKLAEKLKGYLSEASQARPIGVVSYPALMSGKPRVWTVRGESPWFDRREF